MMDVFWVLGFFGGYGFGLGILFVLVLGFVDGFVGLDCFCFGWVWWIVVWFRVFIHIYFFCRLCHYNCCVLFGCCCVVLVLGLLFYVC